MLKFATFFKPILKYSLFEIKPIVSTFTNTVPQSFSTISNHPTLICKPTSTTTITPLRSYEYFSFTHGLSHFLKRRIKYGLPRFRRQRPHYTDCKPFITGIILKTLIKKPKKPNSANRKCVRVRLSTGKEVTAHVPGIGHNLQEHHKVLISGGKTKDLPGVKHKCVRGKHDLPHIKKSV